MRINFKTGYLEKNKKSLCSIFRTNATHVNGSLYGKVSIGKTTMSLPKKYIGKKFRLKVEWLEESPLNAV